MGVNWIYPLRAIADAVLAVVVFAALRRLLISAWRPRRFDPLGRMRDLLAGSAAHHPGRLTRWLGLREGPRKRELQRLLEGCGWRFDAGRYSALKRLLLVLAALPAAGAVIVPQWLARLPAAPIASVAISLLICTVLLSDALVLDWLHRLRSRAIVGEIHEVCKLLLYDAASKRHLHTKLARCIPHTRRIRPDLYRLTNEWYYNAPLALENFKQSVGTPEARHFAETLRALLHHDGEEYYDLLRERIEDYKEKLELTSESRKELTSYVLFLLAGVPVLFTFRVFLFPWVAEGEKLFRLLNG